MPLTHNGNSREESENGIKERCSRRDKKGIFAEATRITDHHSEPSLRLLNRESKRVSGPRLSLPLSYVH